MAQKTISTIKKIIIGRLVVSKNLNISKCARELKISRNTVKRYADLFAEFIDVYPDDIVQNQYEIFLMKPLAVIRPRALEILNLLSFFKENEISSLATAKIAWLKYRVTYPNGYQYSQFTVIFNKWIKEQKTIIRKKWQVQFIPQEDIKTLKCWNSSTVRRKWELSVVLTESYKNTPTSQIAAKVERCSNIVRDWINIYKSQGLTGFEKKKYNTNPIIHQIIEEKRSKLIRLLHESPKFHGINRTSWSLSDLALTYKKIYSINICSSTISHYLKLEGFVYKKARKVLTSPDPNFREKMDKIKYILKNLRKKEKFFSIDEYGPFAVKIKGGRSLMKKSEIKTFPQIQKSKGFTICTAALELSSNQITHFYSQKKDTDEMIKLIDLLLFTYKGQDKLYLSWDAASWHYSKRLNEYIYKINDQYYRKIHHNPIVELAPLPASAQFLNVIESVFSGLAKSIIHNSDYSSLDECKSAISLYFETRNKHFLANPKKAGNIIWGKELVIPVFKDSNNCKDPRYR